MNNLIEEPGSSFGGNWSEQKLQVLSNYLTAYTTALKKQRFSLTYIDAFAGAGKLDIASEQNQHSQSLLIEETDEQEQYRHGSPLVALATTPPFDHFIFIDKNKSSLYNLQNQISDNGYAEKSIDYVLGDANEELMKICCDVNWQSHRAVAFLDPFSTEVKWHTIETIVTTKAIDLWLLFPAMAVNRMMTKTREVPQKWQEKLTECFGTEEWRQVFYPQNRQSILFGEAPDRKVSHPFEVLGKFVNGRLRSIFPGVSKEIVILKNSKNSPLFLLCFACSNPDPKAIGLALKIADHIIGSSQ